MWKAIASNALTLIIVALVAAGGFLAWAQGQYRAEGPLAEPICLRVESGSNMRRVADRLIEEGAIAYPTIFRVGADYSGRAPLLKAGSFLVPAGASMEEIVAIVTGDGRSTCGVEVVYRVGVTGQEMEVRELDPVANRFEVVAEFDPVADAAPDRYREVRGEADTRYRVAVAEGVTSWQVVEALKAADFLEGSVEAVPAEGSLAPDSYEIRAGTEKAELLARMAEVQAARLAEAWQNRAGDLPIDSPEEALILASIIEKETAIPEERPLVSGVLVNRIERGWRLQFDPTIIYGITRGIGTLDRPISNADVNGATEQRLHGAIEYNTYQIDGLPAGPIGNPGLAAIEAAVAPADTDYMFFAADGTGGHAFAVTIDEHNRNVARLREIERERREAEQSGDQ